MITTFSNGIDDDDDSDKKFCIVCLRKTPPVKTILKVGENITEARHNRGIWWCDDCYKKYQKDYREEKKKDWSRYEREKEEQELEKFEMEWNNDKEFRTVKELSDKIILVWNKYKRREPELGLLKDIICCVIFPDYWNVTVNKVIEDLLRTRKDTASIQNRHREVLHLYIPSIIDIFTEEYRNLARNKWDVLVASVNSKYAGKEKLVAKPPHKDERTKRNEYRWYLLSYKPQLDDRNQVNENKKRRIDYQMDVEFNVVKEHEQMKSSEEFEKTRRTNKERNSSSTEKDDEDKEKREGGE